MTKTKLYRFCESYVDEPEVIFDRESNSVFVDSETWNDTVMSDNADYWQKAVVVVDGRFKPVDLRKGLNGGLKDLRWPVLDIDVGPAKEKPTIDELLLLRDVPVCNKWGWEAYVLERLTQTQGDVHNVDPKSDDALVQLMRSPTGAFKDSVRKALVSVVEDIDCADVFQFRKVLWPQLMAVSKSLEPATELASKPLSEGGAVREWVAVHADIDRCRRFVVCHKINDSEREAGREDVVGTAPTLGEALAAMEAFAKTHSPVADLEDEEELGCRPRM
ncbi:hypothetical protein [Chromobacterium haemolyticum]|uniref:hypothetical protein n=1 Tax=Chromobacterium haemolyticum TaxID=394935 RepID=UPI0024480B5C|nr:hypothetical protein [Chromobacterium haemolyticum]MDH0342042.1 hypothetical protein [Chromobacterium haemolyticum]